MIDTRGSFSRAIGDPIKPDAPVMAINIENAIGNGDPRSVQAHGSRAFLVSEWSLV